MLALQELLLSRVNVFVDFRDMQLCTECMYALNRVTSSSQEGGRDTRTGVALLAMVVD